MPKIMNAESVKEGILLSDIKEYIDLHYKDSMLDLLYRRAKKQEEELHEYGQEIGQLRDCCEDMQRRLNVYNLALGLACKRLDEELSGYGRLYFTPGGDTLETLYLKQAQREVSGE